MGFAEWHILDILFVVMGLELLPLELLVHFLGEQPQREQFLWLLKARKKMLIKNVILKCVLSIIYKCKQNIKICND